MFGPFLRKTLSASSSCFATQPVAPVVDSAWSCSLLGFPPGTSKAKSLHMHAVSRRPCLYCKARKVLVVTYTLVGRKQSRRRNNGRFLWRRSGLGMRAWRQVQSEILILVLYIMSIATLISLLPLSSPAALLKNGRDLVLNGNQLPHRLHHQSGSGACTGLILTYVQRITICMHHYLWVSYLTHGFTPKHFLLKKTEKSNTKESDTHHTRPLEIKHIAPEKLHHAFEMANKYSHHQTPHIRGLSSVLLSSVLRWDGDTHEQLVRHLSRHP